MRKTTIKCCYLMLLLLTGIQVAQAQSAQRKTTNSKQLAPGTPFNGVLQGKMTVNANGAATYSISLTLPPGNQGAAPSLQLSFNSQSGNGLLGMGWGITGISAITRSGATVPQDGFRGGVNYDTNDRFSLSGTRLMNNSAQSGTYFTPRSTYFTQQQSWKKVTALGTAGQGPEAFIVQLKNGSTATFGTGYGSQVVAQGADFNSGALKGTIKKWMVQEYVSTTGNKVKFSYSKTPANIQGQPMTGCASDGTSYPDVISYGSTYTNESNRFVKFYYEPRPDTLLYFAGGANSAISVRLKAIRTYIVKGQDTVPVKTYWLTYDSTNPAPISRIAAINEYGTYGGATAPITLQWTNGPNGFVQQSARYEGPPTNTGYEGDFNGDGKTDLLPLNSASMVEAIYYANGSGFTMQKLPSPIDISDQSYVADYNGDGFPDLMVLNAGLANIYFCDPQTHVLSAKPVVTRDLKFNTNCSNCIFTSDMNGDGMADLLSIMGTTAYVYLSNGNGFKPAQTISNMQLASGEIFVVDVNGDSQADLYSADSKSGTLYLSNFSQSNQFAAPIPIAGMNISADPGSNLVADFNNDGLTDLLTFNGQAYTMYFSNGKGFAAGQPLSGMNLNSTTNWISDFNGDGTMDIYAFNGTLATVYYNYCGKFYPQPTRPPTVQTGYAWLGDFNGDGVADIFTANNNTIYFGGDQNSGTVQTSNQVPDLVTSINNGINGTYQFQHTPMTSSAVYSQGGNNNALVDGLYLQNRYNSTVLSATQSSLYPYVSTQSSSYLVQRYVLSDGMGNNYPYNFKYSGSLTDMQAYGWLGFSQVQETDSSAGNVTTNTYLQQFPFTGKVQSCTTQDLKGNLLSRNRNQYYQQADTFNTNAICYQVFNAANRIDHYDYGQFAFTIGTNYGYDDFGNTVLTEQLNDTAENHRLLTEVRYINDSVTWHIGYKHEQRIASDTTQAAILQQQTWQYNNQRSWLPNQNSMWLNANNTWLNNQYGYDIYGNQIMTVNAAGDTNRIVVDTAYHSFPAKMISPPNQWGNQLTTLIKIDPANGQTISTTDANNITFTTLCDQFGRDSVSLGPDSTGKQVVLSNYAYFTNLPAGFVQQRVVRSNWAGTQWDTSFVVYDGLSREVQRSWQGINRQQVLQQKAYNSNNQLTVFSLPYFPSDSAQVTRLSYDPYRRPVQISIPGPGNSTISNIFNYYNKTTAITLAASTPDSATIYRTVDYYGGKPKPTQATDATKLTTTYQYDPLGRIIQVTDPGGLTSTYTYFSTGDLASTTNPASGTTQYLRNYTNNNFLVVPAKGDTIFCEMDALQRRIAVATHYQNTSYQYDLSTVKNGMTNLCKVVDSLLQTTHTYNYDGYHRPISTNIHTANYSCTEQNSYNPDGSIALLIYPDSSVANYSYYNNGYLRQVTFAEGLNATPTPYLTIPQYDAYGDQLQLIYGNQVQRNATYLPFGKVLNYSILSGDTTLANKTYSWTNRYNVASITDHLVPANSETYQYAPNGRLIQASNSLSSASYQYNPSGNLTLKDNITYTYNNNYQVITGTLQGQQVYSASYDKNGNLSGHTISLQGNTTPFTFGYNTFNQLTAILSGSDTLSAFAYDYTGQRTFKKDFKSGSTEIYVSPNYNVINNSKGSQGIRFVQIPGQRIASISTTKGPSYLHGNFINSTLLTTNTTGAATSNMKYTPYGTLDTITGSITTDYLFSGMELDENGLYYFNARYYNPITGRFITADNQLGGKPYQSDVYNRYAYALNNPVKNYDPSGHFLMDAEIIETFEGSVELMTLVDMATAMVAPEAVLADAIEDVLATYISDERFARIDELAALAQEEVGPHFWAALGDGLKDRSLTRAEIVPIYKSYRDYYQGMSVEERLNIAIRKPKASIFRGVNDVYGFDAYGNRIFQNTDPEGLKDEKLERDSYLEMGWARWAQTPQQINEALNSSDEDFKFTISFRDFQVKVGSSIISHAAVEGEGDLTYGAGYVSLNQDNNLVLKNVTGHYRATGESLRNSASIWMQMRRAGTIQFNKIIYAPSNF
ncbi:FG-GAP-like repeat-containing protein [Chitinophaga sp. sic0106]|uniref:FG-GAP-like repeat-containing protein n=1 Tax=Chitinophaga sp. sic0106 TaxID=2854785 RepID=UPI001C49536F|nr:FG-GAP-like repeat-containing protein [Chitinophaga sp. sic0106]MBV7531424.1 VCBS repeat-containing protein [Chitinophaga sp. sic0106]